MIIFYVLEKSSDTHSVVYFCFGIVEPNASYLRENANPVVAIDHHHLRFAVRVDRMIGETNFISCVDYARFSQEYGK